MEADELADSLRSALVDDLVARGGIRSAEVERAFRTVPRHRLLERFWVHEGPTATRRFDLDPSAPDPAALEAAYRDSALTEDADDLLADLLAHVERWRSLGAPAAADFTSSFLPLDQPAVEDERTWVIDRLAHRQVVTLP